MFPSIPHLTSEIHTCSSPTVLVCSNSSPTDNGRSRLHRQTMCSSGGPRLRNSTCLSAINAVHTQETDIGRWHISQKQSTLQQTHGTASLPRSPQECHGEREISRLEKRINESTPHAITNNSTSALCYSSVVPISAIPNTPYPHVSGANFFLIHIRKACNQGSDMVLMGSCF
jgi:hypothetical protein